MEHTAPQKHSLRRLAYTAGFFLNFNLAISSYINSSFLEHYVGEHYVGLLYALGAVLMIAASLPVNRLTRRFGNRHVLIWLSLGNIAALFGIVFFDGAFAPPWAGLTAIILLAYTVLSYLLSVNLDLYLESVSDDSLTGRIRGFFLTICNLAWLLSPWLASRLVGTDQYFRVYAVSGLALIPFLLIVLRLRNTAHEEYQHLPFFESVKRIWDKQDDKDRNLHQIIVLDFLLNFFYAIMVIYTPIYLHEHIGLDWLAIGQIFTIMLLPFVLTEFVLGDVADKIFGEKEILTVGLLIAGGATLMIPFLGGTSPAGGGASILAWGALLFATRVGASAIEVMKETYLFKQISAGDINALFLSRNTYPLAYIIAPLLASLLLLFLPLEYLFLLLGLIMLWGTSKSIKLVDTR